MFDFYFGLWFPLSVLCRDSILWSYSNGFSWNSFYQSKLHSCQLQSAGNEAVRSGRYAEAVEHYTAALSNNIESRPFSAICFGNRAAAHQALGQIADAIADCSLAVALDGNYSKVYLKNICLFTIELKILYGPLRIKCFFEREK